MSEKDLSAFSDKSNILSDGELLSAGGALEESGYAFAHVKRYSNDAVKKRRARIKERDCYYFGDDRHAVALSVSHSAHSAVATVIVLDFIHIAKAVKRKVVPKGGASMPSSIGEGNIEFDGGGLKISFTVANGKRTLKCECKEIVGKKDFECEIELDEFDGDCITAAMPLENDGEFFYGTRTSCLKGGGWYTLGGERVEFSREARGELDWTRCVYPHKCVVYSAGMSTEIDGKAFGIGISKIGVKRFIDRNAIFCDGKGSKLNGVKFEIPFTTGALDYLKPWKITDDDGRIGLMFYPMIEVVEKTRIGLGAIRHKVFGKYYGKATLEDGTIIDIADKIGYAEHLQTRW